MKLEPKVGLFKVPVLTVGFCDPACAARSNTRFRVKVEERMEGKCGNSDRWSVRSRHRYVQSGFTILRAKVAQGIVAEQRFLDRRSV